MYSYSLNTDFTESSRGGTLLFQPIIGFASKIKIINVVTVSRFVKTIWYFQKAPKVWLMQIRFGILETSCSTYTQANWCPHVESRYDFFFLQTRKHFSSHMTRRFARLPDSASLKEVSCLSMFINEAVFSWNPSVHCFQEFVQESWISWNERHDREDIPPSSVKSVEKKW